LVDIDGSDQNCSHGDLLPKGRESEDNETVEQNNRDDRADQRAH
jgi:hypothetical protein